MPAPTTAMRRGELALTEAGRAVGRDLGGMSFVLFRLNVVAKIVVIVGPGHWF
jgi:hypothetical protein